MMFPAKMAIMFTTDCTPLSALDYAARRTRAIASLAENDSASGLPDLDDDVPLVGMIDLDLLDSLFDELDTAFDTSRKVLHAIACKAAPIKSLLQRYAVRGAGCEVASKGELELAVAAGFAPDKIVFDPPAKTRTELKRALELGVSMNIDNFEELERVDQILAELGLHLRGEDLPTIGLRINPQTGSGEIEALSTASATSKFGFGLADSGSRSEIVRAYL